MVKNCSGATKKLRLQYIDIETKKVTQVAKATDWEIRSYNWSPDSRWITYVLPQNGASSQVYIYGLESNETNAVTDEWYDSGSPSFSSDGNYLFFLHHAISTQFIVIPSGTMPIEI